MNKMLLLIFFCFLFFSESLYAKNQQIESVVTNEKHFLIMPLGTSGGELEDNLSAYLVAPIHSKEYISLDAGTLCSSIKKISPGEFLKLGIEATPPKTLAENFLTQNIKAYLISHAHLDHISGLVICSSIDSNKEILGTETTINYLKKFIFNWKIWPNFSDQGIPPFLKKYHYHVLKIGEATNIESTHMQVRAFLLNHGNGYPSSAFLLKANDRYMLYVGDTGADSIEHSHNLENLWQVITPLIRSHKLAAIFIESSYDNSRSTNQLFGHLTPRLLLLELNLLAHLVNPKNPQAALKGLTVIVTHIKQGLGNENSKRIIFQQLMKENHLEVNFVLPQAGKSMTI